MRQETSTYYLCNKENQKIIQFEIMFFPLDFIICNTKVIAPFLIPSFFQLDCLDEFLCSYLKSQMEDRGKGWDLDEYIINTLHLSDKVKSYGRLYGMDYIITLLTTHFKDERNGLYITAKDPTTISFFGEVWGWNRILIDTPVEWRKTNVLNA